MRRPGLIVTVIVVVAVATVSLWAFDPHLPRPPQTVAAGVRLGDEQIGGLAIEDVRSLLASLAPGLRVAPVEPRRDPDTRGNVPGLDGMELDMDATLMEALKAAPSSTIPFRFKPIAPKMTLGDLPLAPIYQGNPEKPAFAVLVNVAWGNEWLPGLLDVLARHHAKATFFLMGDWAAGNGDLAKEIADGGNEIASHGYSAVEWDSLGRTQMLNQISQADDAIKQATGVRPVWFSTHKGVVSQGILKAARDLGHETVMWTVDTVDWRKPTVDWMVQRVLKRAGSGSLILMHPTERTPAALDAILTGLERRGLEPLTLSDLLSPRRLTAKPLSPSGSPTPSEDTDRSR